jgi:hypothetical protein
VGDSSALMFGTHNCNAVARCTKALIIRYAWDIHVKMYQYGTDPFYHLVFIYKVIQISK